MLVFESSCFEKPDSPIFDALIDSVFSSLHTMLSHFIENQLPLNCLFFVLAILFTVLEEKK